MDMKKNAIIILVASAAIVGYVMMKNQREAVNVPNNMLIPPHAPVNEQNPTPNEINPNNMPTTIPGQAPNAVEAQPHAPAAAPVPNAEVPHVPANPEQHPAPGVEPMAPSNNPAVEGQKIPNAPAGVESHAPVTAPTPTPAAPAAAVSVNNGTPAEEASAPINHPAPVAPQTVNQPAAQ